MMHDDADTDAEIPMQTTATIFLIHRDVQKGKIKSRHHFGECLSWVQSKVEETPFQTKRRRLPFPLPQSFGGEGAPSGAGEEVRRFRTSGF
jgi:hypothetical protein